MKRNLRMLIAALFAAGAAGAIAQADPAAAPNAPAPAKSAQAYVEEPVASVSRNSGPNAEAANAIMQALNADPSMKPSKITVQPEESGILLTGVTSTHAQRERAQAMAAQHAGEGKVSNALTSEEILVFVNEPAPAAGADEAAPADAEQAPAGSDQAAAGVNEAPAAAPQGQPAS